MKKSNFKKEFKDSNYICPFKNKRCNIDNCTHFKHEYDTYYWGNEIKIFDEGVCYAGRSDIQLWKSIFTIHPAFKNNPPFWEIYKEFRKEGFNPIRALIAADMFPKEKIPYDFEEIFRQIQEGIFDPMILPLKDENRK